MVIINGVSYNDYREICNAFDIDYKDFLTYKLQNSDISELDLLGHFIKYLSYRLDGVYVIREPISTPFRSFHEFERLLLSGIRENIPGADIYIRKGGDSVRDILLEVIIGDKGLQFYPHDLYEEALPGNKYEEVINDFIKKCKEL